MAVGVSEDSTIDLDADSGDGRMGLKADAGAILKFGGDADGGDGDGDAGEGELGPDGLDLYPKGRDNCGGGMDGDNGEGGRMGLRADAGIVS